MRVLVTMDGGVIQHVVRPPGVQVVVRDYDVDGCPEEELLEDEDGDKYIETTWP